MEITQEKKREFKEANLTNHYLFQELFKDEYIFKSIVEEILQIDIGEIVTVTRESREGNRMFCHEISCDLLGITKKRVLINLELQNKNEQNLLKRSRYYVGLLQTRYYDAIEQDRVTYDEVPDCYSIWLCTFDLFKDHSGINTIVPYREEMGVIEEDGSVRIFIDIRKYDKFSTKLQGLFRFMLESTKENATCAKWDVVELLYSKMANLKESQERLVEFVRYGTARENGYFEGRAEGREEGKAEGKVGEKIETIKIMFMKNFDINTIAEITRISTEEVQRVIEELNPA